MPSRGRGENPNPKLFLPVTSKSCKANRLKRVVVTVTGGLVKAPTLMIHRCTVIGQLFANIGQYWAPTSTNTAQCY